MDHRVVVAGAGLTPIAGEIDLGPREAIGTCIVAVDGGSGAGKSTLADALAGLLDADVVRTDDLAWHTNFFGWWPLLVEHVLRPLHDGTEVAFRPNAWIERGRSGAITASPGGVVVVEGVGSGRRELSPWIDHLVWVDTDRQLAMDRALERPGETVAFWREWGAAEEEHLDADRPWERADTIVRIDELGPPLRITLHDTATWDRRDRPSSS